ncbi:GGDEF domain-containing protein [Sulfurihydrogenibium subterraneum]|uniref:GGDEF domain-containing protein n=1 Tax=Sulfurihydrogenibium subterraneum TaxID=171121 RepID=UPI001FE1DC85|nr:GGDEF domain-containing protein [Sulfurihydrogenibium subterraneum]
MNGCKILDKIESFGDRLKEEELETLLEIIRRQVKFMLKYNILMTPKNYERWFLVFCHLVESKESLTDKEIFNLYGRLYEKNFNIGKDENFFEKDIRQTSEKLEKIADNIEEKLFDILNVAYLHRENIIKHEEITKRSDDEKFSKILQELEFIKHQNENLTEKLENYHKEIQKLNIELKIAKQDATIDFLTGVVNRRSFDRTLEDLLKEVRDKDYIFTLILLDIDNFKAINDTYGHLAGDLVLKEISNVLRIFLRANTIIGRIGGEEFGIILPGVPLENGIKVAERIRNIIENREVRFEDRIIKFTASFGVTESKKEDTKESIYKRADEALYIAKRSGKNKVAFF